MASWKGLQSETYCIHPANQPDWTNTTNQPEVSRQTIIIQGFTLNMTMMTLLIIHTNIWWNSQGLDGLNYTTRGKDNLLSTSIFIIEMKHLNYLNKTKSQTNITAVWCCWILDSIIFLYYIIIIIPLIILTLTDLF